MAFVFTCVQRYELCTRYSLQKGCQCLGSERRVKDQTHLTYKFYFFMLDGASSVQHCLGLISCLKRFFCFCFLKRYSLWNLDLMYAYHC